MKRKVITFGIGGFDASKPNNNIIEEIELDEQDQPLDRVGALVTLLTVQGLLDINDAANAVQLAPEDLVKEAQAWAVAEGMANG